jgi:sporulation protein YlmC with PRC-barrel domain
MPVSPTKSTISPPTMRAEGSKYRCILICKETLSIIDEYRRAFAGRIPSITPCRRKTNFAFLHPKSAQKLFLGGIMAQFGTLRSYASENATEDIRGSHVYGVNDEKLGKITDVVFNYATGDILYAVVDTGGWLSTKEFIVPAERIRVSAKHENDFEVSLTKSQVENFPPYNQKDLESDKTWGDYETRYRAKWDDGPVMHREGSDRNITPPADQIPVVRNASPITEISTSGSMTGRIVPAGSDSVVIENSASGIGGRWDTFQSRLRERRKQSAFGGTTTAGSESVADFRKAV